MPRAVLVAGAVLVGLGAVYLGAVLGVRRWFRRRPLADRVP